MLKNMEILDGGMGHMIKRLGVEIEGSQPGAIERFYNLTMANILDPDLVQKAHTEFLKAGSTVITTNNYAAIPKCLRSDQHMDSEKTDRNPVTEKDIYSRYSIDQILRETGFFKGSGGNDYNQIKALQFWKNVMVSSGENAIKARDQFVVSCKQKPFDSINNQKNCSVKVAGALPPLSESYRHDLVGPYTENVMQYQIVVNTLIDYVDLFICETMSTIAESKSAVEAATTVMKEKKQEKPIWVSWTLDDNSDETEPVLRSGESIKEALKSLAKQVKPNGLVEAFLFNCSSPDVISTGLGVLDKEIRLLNLDAKSGAYANGFLQIFDENKNFSSSKPNESNDAKEKESISEYRQDLTPFEYFERYAKQWTKNETVKIVGGCCGIFPEHIKYLSSEISKYQ